jgi:hypothetical protein
LGKAREKNSHKRFYEKVIKVKADVAAVLNYFFSSFIGLRWVRWGAVKGAAEWGRVHLDP